VHLAAANPKKFNELVAPTNGCSFNDVCTFVASVADSGIEVSCLKAVLRLFHAAGKHCVPVFIYLVRAIDALQVECTAVKAPGLRVREVSALATSLGASSFKTRSFHP